MAYLAVYDQEAIYQTLGALSGPLVLHAFNPHASHSSLATAAAVSSWTYNSWSKGVTLCTGDAAVDSLVSCLTPADLYANFKAAFQPASEVISSTQGHSGFVYHNASSVVIDHPVCPTRPTTVNVDAVYPVSTAVKHETCGLIKPEDSPVPAFVYNTTIHEPCPTRLPLLSQVAILNPPTVAVTVSLPGSKDAQFLAMVSILMVVISLTTGLFFHRSPHTSTSSSISSDPNAIRDLAASEDVDSPVISNPTPIQLKQTTGAARTITRTSKGPIKSVILRAKNRKGSITSATRCANAAASPPSPVPASTRITVSPITTTLPSALKLSKPAPLLKVRQQPPKAPISAQVTPSHSARSPSPHLSAPSPPDSSWTVVGRGKTRAPATVRPAPPVRSAAAPPMSKPASSSAVIKSAAITRTSPRIHKDSPFSPSIYKPTLFSEFVENLIKAPSPRRSTIKTTPSSYASATKIALSVPTPASLPPVAVVPSPQPQSSRLAGLKPSASETPRASTHPFPLHTLKAGTSSTIHSTAVRPPFVVGSFACIASGSTTTTNSTSIVAAATGGSKAIMTYGLTVVPASPRATKTAVPSQKVVDPKLPSSPAPCPSAFQASTPRTSPPSKAQLASYVPLVTSVLKKNCATVVEAVKVNPTSASGASTTDEAQPCSPTATYRDAAPGRDITNLPKGSNESKMTNAKMMPLRPGLFSSPVTIRTSSNNSSAPTSSSPPTPYHPPSPSALSTKSSTEDDMVVVPRNAAAAKLAAYIANGRRYWPRKNVGPGSKPMKTGDENDPPSSS